MDSSFVGRAVELSLLEDVFIRAQREERPIAALVSGLPGSGKTRLLAELHGRHSAGRQLAMVGYQTGSLVPLAAAGDLLRALAKVPIQGARLEGLLFGGGRRDEDTLEPLRVFEAAHRALIALEGTLMLFVDDLQWVDELSVGLCAYLVRAADAEGKGVAIIAASRPASAGAPFYDWMTRELGPDRVTIVELGPLDRGDGVRLAQQIAPNLSPERAAELWTTAEGSPFWLGVLARSGGGRDLGAYLTARERALSRDARWLLALLAVAARPLSPKELSSLLEWNEDRLGHAVAELDVSGLAVTQGISIRPAHDLIRVSVDAQLPLSQLRQLHALFGSWLKRQDGGDIQLLEEAMVHCREGGLDVSDLAFRLLQSPRRRLLSREGLRDVSRIADSLGFSDAAGVALREQVALLASELGEHRVAMERWVELARNVGDPAQRARYYLGASRAASWIVERREDALPLLTQARSQETVDATLGVEIDAHQSNLLRLLEHRMDEARRVAEQAVLAARRLWAHLDMINISFRERNAYVAALQAAFDAAVIEADGDTMLRISEEMMQVASGSEESTLWAALNTSSALWFLGRTAESVDHARRVWLHSRERALPMLTLAAGAALAGKLIEFGELADADEVTSECVELERRVGAGAHRLAMGKVAARSIHDLRHVVWFSRGNWRDCAISLEREVALQPDPHYRLHLHGVAVVWLSRLGGGPRTADIDRHVAAARADAIAAGCRRCAREMALRVAEALVRLGRLEDAQRELRAWDADRHAAEPDEQLWRRHVGALTALARHDTTDAVAELEAVIVERRRLGLAAGVIWARLDLAGGLLGSDAGRAVQELRQAGIEANAHGASSQQGLAELGLRKLGVRTWRRGRASAGKSTLDTLSQRERQIATLVAAGNTNPEIANTLFLSRKTVERHVSNVLARTGARNRTDLARMISS